MNKGLSHGAKFATIAAAGPISGPLIARFVHHARRGDKFIASLYLLALVEWGFLLYLLAEKLSVGAQVI